MIAAEVHDTLCAWRQPVRIAFEHSKVKAKAKVKVKVKVNVEGFKIGCLYHGAKQKRES